MRSVTLTGDGEPASNFSNTEVAWTSSSSSSASRIMENMTEEAVALSDILEDDNFTSHLSSSNLDLQTESPPDEASSVMVVETAPVTDIISEDNLTDTGTDLEPMEAMLTMPIISTSTEGMEEEILSTDDGLFSINIDRNTSHSPFAHITESKTFVSAESELELGLNKPSFHLGRLHPPVVPVALHLGVLRTRRTPNDQIGLLQPNNTKDL